MEEKERVVLGMETKAALRRTTIKDASMSEEEENSVGERSGVEREEKVRQSALSKHQRGEFGRGT